jgi:hypothetical protein
MSNETGAERAGTLEFWGAPEAELFGREVAESYQGVLKLSYVREPGGAYPPGFIHASPPKQYWSGTMWTRDAGTFLRELVLWGDFARARLTAGCLMDLSPLNAQGFHTFPEYFRGYAARSEFEVDNHHTYPTPTTADAEVDGLGAIAISLALLWQRLPERHACKERLYEFLHDGASPVRFLHMLLQQAPLIAGGGEFGGGRGLACNVVQNNLVRLALLAAADVEDEAGDAVAADIYRADAARLLDNMQRYLVDEAGGWIWCVDPVTLRPDPAYLDRDDLKGYGGVNGVASMSADVLGLEPARTDPAFARCCDRTFERLYANPTRREQFERYGLWTSLDHPALGLATNASYVGGYALQTMLLHDRLDMAGRSLRWLADATYHAEQWGVLFTTFETGRVSPWYFYERYYSPEAVGHHDMLCGCGPLNLVCTAEPIKVSRLLLGVDDHAPDEVRLMPRLPPEWQGMRAGAWPICTRAGLSRVDLQIERGSAALHLKVKLVDGPPIPQLAVRLPSAAGYVWSQHADVQKLEV